MNLEREIKLCVNGTEHKVDISCLSLDTTLNAFLRSKLNLTGTKRMCLEGGCGACIVAVQRKNHVAKKIITQAINSCLVPLFSCHGWKIVTIEGLAGSQNDHHYLQKVLAEFNGSQCGFCSPGMVMNMFGLLQEKKLTKQEVENSFGGNICRCTGYRPILSAFKSVCDIEDIKPCPKVASRKSAPCYFNLGKTTWIKVFLFDDLLQVLRTFESSTYKLIAGNTSTGVYKCDGGYQVYVDVADVDELTSCKMEKGHLVVGANITLTETMNLFDKISQENGDFSYLKKLEKHVDLIANVPVRNLGTLAGNLMIKHRHNEFPSDIFLIFETVNAVLLLVDTDKNESKICVKDLLKTPMGGKLIKKIILPPLSPKFKYESYKIMPRAQNAHALVNAGFLLELNAQNIVQSARIVFGSINPTFVRATNTEKFLTGKKLFHDEILQSAFEILDKELVPDAVPGEPEPRFRKQLAIALFYKYVLSITPKNLISRQNQTGGVLLERGLSSGSHVYESDKSKYPLTRPMAKREALAQASGQAEYVMDMPDRPKQLFGAFVLAKVRALSTVRKVDTSQAMKLDGVVAFFSSDDIPGRNNFTPKETNSLFFSVEEEIFCSGLVQYYNQPVGLVVATSQELAENAASLVRVTYNAGKAPLLTIQDVVKAKKESLDTEIGPKSRGKDITHVLKGRSELSCQYHYHMETQCCSVVPTEDGLDMYPSSQWLDLSQTSAATTLNIPINKINVAIRRLGGAFGGKISRNALISSAAALAAYKLKRPVKIWLPFETNMDMVGKRYPMLWDYEMGVDGSGTIQYLDLTLYSDYGVGGNEPNLPYVLDAVLGAYRTDFWHVKAYKVSTNNPASCYIRAPGTCEGLAIIESIMEHAAVTLGIDPTDFRLKNMKAEHDLLAQFVKELYKWADIDVRKQQIKRFNEENRWRKKGLAVVPMVYHFHLFGNYEVVVSVYKSDGSVAIAHGGVEMGQGINTKVIQVCAYKLKIPVEKISVKPSNNLIAPNAHMVGGSLTSETVCHGVIKACDILLERMEPVKKQLENASWEEIVQECYNQYVNLSASSMGSPSELKNYAIYGVCSSEIELDVLTGQYIVQRVDLLEDAGTSMNAGIDMGQVEGAFVMGMGYFTSEKIIFSESGELLTNRTWNYKPPGARDVPVDFRIKFPGDTPNGVGVLNSKAIGEPPLCLACSVPLAIRNAVASARKETRNSCDEWYPFSGPSTVEDVFTNCLHDFKQYTL
ncbi:uncharacterized protein LOC656938 [Tribolium castaneum]|uniref:Indole-3-acetaldehyde oxidase n=1 Tax=Tribolium castaneum TaxID=7070 RepID=D6W6X3_TRICA|nr:Xanthine dehydrogenase-like Protein [Tribolium castaneum]